LIGQYVNWRNSSLIFPNEKVSNKKKKTMKPKKSRKKIQKLNNNKKDNKIDNYKKTFKKRTTKK